MLLKISRQERTHYSVLEICYHLIISLHMNADTSFCSRTNKGGKAEVQDKQNKFGITVVRICRLFFLAIHL